MLELRCLDPLSMLSKAKELVTCTWGGVIYVTYIMIKSKTLISFVYNQAIA